MRPLLSCVCLALLAAAPVLAAPASQPAAPPAAPAAFEPGPPAPGAFPRATAAEAGIAPARLDALLAAAAAGNSSALLVLRDGRAVAERYFRDPGDYVGLMSITKPVTSLAIGMLVDEGRIASVDQPMSTWLPEWAADPRKSRVTLRHVLTHTSGVGQQLGGPAIYRHPDWVAFARGLPASHEPGTKWEYNNAMIELLAEVVRQASGEPLDRYLDARLFRPLGITRWDWRRDPQGNPEAFGGLALHPRDLAKIGQLVQLGGRWQGRRIVSEAWLQASATPAGRRWSYQGLGWMLGFRRAFSVQSAASRDRLRAVGEGALADRLAPLDGRRFPMGPGPLGYFAAVRALLGPDATATLGHLWQERRLSTTDELQDGEGRVLMHDGSYGQLLIVDPTERLVIVRMYAPRRGSGGASPELDPIRKAAMDLLKP